MLTKKIRCNSSHIICLHYESSQIQSQFSFGCTFEHHIYLCSVIACQIKSRFILPFFGFFSKSNRLYDPVAKKMHRPANRLTMAGFEHFFFPKNNASFFVLKLIWFLNNGVTNVKTNKYVLCTIH